MMKHYKTDMSNKSRTFAPIMETKIETTNTGGQVLAYDGEEARRPTGVFFGRQRHEY